MSTDRYEGIAYLLLLIVFVLSITIWFLVTDAFLRMFVYIGLVLVFLNIDFIFASRRGGFLGVWSVFLVLALISASVVYGLSYGVSYFIAYTILILLWLRIFPEATGLLRGVDWRYIVFTSFPIVFILGFLGFDGSSMIVLSPLWELLVYKSFCGDKTLIGGFVSSLFSSSILIVYPVVFVYTVLTGVFKWRLRFNLGIVIALDIVLRASIIAGWMLWM